MKADVMERRRQGLLCSVGFSFYLLYKRDFFLRKIVEFIHQLIDLALKARDCGTIRIGEDSFHAIDDRLLLLRRRIDGEPVPYINKQLVKTTTKAG